MKFLAQKLRAGELVGVVVLGDSIARGDEAPTPSKSWVSLCADELHARYGSRVGVTNLSQGGYTSRDVLKAIRRVRGLADFDLVIIAVGVNDAAQGLAPRRFIRNVRRAARLAHSSGLDVILVAPLRPTNADVQPYRDQLAELQLPFVDVTSAWPGEHLLANRVNHPDEHGHRLYADLLIALIEAEVGPAQVGREPKSGSDARSGQLQGAAR